MKGKTTTNYKLHLLGELQVSWGGGQRSPLLNEAWRSENPRKIKKKKHPQEERRTRTKTQTGRDVLKKLTSYWTAQWTSGVPDWFGGGATEEEIK